LIARPFGLKARTFNRKHKHHTLAFCPTRSAHAQNVASWECVAKATIGA